MVGTFWSLVPAIVAIALALITKEVYSSLFIGILIGGVFYSGLSFTGFFTHVFQDGFITQLSDSYNVGILLFLVVLGIMVALMNKAGGSAAFGNWAKKHIKSKVGAQLATICLGVMIFIDDYFNCLTVGSVMRPVTDKYKVSREKLAYLIDATAAPVCIIAPISSWAAAVSGFVTEGENGLALFIKAIPFNFYALLTIVMMLALVLMKTEYGKMSKYEKALQMMSDADYEEESPIGNGKVIDLVFPIVVLIVMCTLGMIYSGGFFTEGETQWNFIDSFANSDASVGLVLGSFATLIITVLVYVIRRVLPFKECMSCVPDGFKAMVPAIIILSLAWTLKAMTDSLGAKDFVATLVSGSAAGFMNFLPAIIFVIACGLAFATGTSWGTFGILIPICIAVFPDSSDALRVISISACMAGAVCGDHCSPISDTTIMASAGAQCNHVNHVNSQLPYALAVAAISFVTYIIAGFVKNPFVPFICGVAIMAGLFIFLKKKCADK
jgi:Na+/H+ antiporter NhaC